MSGIGNRAIGRHPRLASLCAIAVVAALASVCVLGTAPAPAASGASVACGSSAFATLASADEQMMNDIYANELAGTEVSSDLAQITGSTRLLSAVAGDDVAATIKAVRRLVFHPAWHIVELLVRDAAGKILAEIGGPYVIAPVPGVLRSGGRIVGSFLMSVQDDTGFTKLETRFIGNPIAIYLHGRRIAERYAKFPASPPGGPDLTLDGVSYQAVTETYKAFPVGATSSEIGTLTAVMLVPPPAPSLSAQSCALDRADEFGRVASRLARLAVSLPRHYQGYATTTQIFTGADIFVRRGTQQLASAGGPGPAELPDSGTVSYEGRNWLVFSFEPQPSTRIYVLIPPSAQ